MRRVKVLVAGLNGMQNEVLKNLVLGGVGQVTVMDDKQVNQRDLQTQFLLHGKRSLGQNRAEAMLPALRDLNPKVTVEGLTDSVVDKPVEFFQQFDVVSLAGCGYDQMIRLNEVCREAGVKFYASDSTAGAAWVFCDVGKYNYEMYAHN